MGQAVGLHGPQSVLVHEGDEEKHYENTDPKCNLPQVVTVHRKWEAVMEEKAQPVHVKI